MKLVSKVQFLATEDKKSAKGNDYKVSCFLQGADTLTCMDKSNGIKAKFGEELVGIFDYDVKYHGLTFLGIQGTN